MQERMSVVAGVLGLHSFGGERTGQWAWRASLAAEAGHDMELDVEEAGLWCEDCRCSREAACSSCTLAEWQPRGIDDDFDEKYIPCFWCVPTWATHAMEQTAAYSVLQTMSNEFLTLLAAMVCCPCAIFKALGRLKVDDGLGARWRFRDGREWQLLSHAKTDCLANVATVMLLLISCPFMCVLWPVLGAVTVPCFAGAVVASGRARGSVASARARRSARRDAVAGAAELAALRKEAPAVLGQLPPQLRRFKLEWREDSKSLGIAKRRAGGEAQQTLELTSLKGLPQLAVEEGIDVLVRLGPDADVEDRRLPADSSFGGDVALLSGAEAGVELADGLSVAGELTVIARGGLRSVGGNVRVNGHLHVREATPSLVRLPESVYVGGTWDLRHCTALEALPESLETAASINLEGCTSIEQLPANLGVVLGDLILTGCSALRSLPPGLRVYGSLILNGCTSLQNIPETVMPMGRELDIRNCAQLEMLPLEVLTSAARHGERALRVRFNEGTGLADDVVETWDAAARSDGGGWLFHYTGDGSGLGDSMEARAAHIQAPSWSTLADVAREFGVQVDDLTPYIDKAYISGVVRFLSMLLDSAEFRSEKLRPGLKARVKEVLELLAKDESVREEVVLRMLDALDACNDKPVWALGQMHVVKAIAEARGDRKALRKLGRRVLRLGIVHEHVEAFINGVDSRAVDDVCVYLRFEIALKSELDLPVSSSAMIYPDHVRVSAAVIKAAAKEAKAVSDERFEAWLVDWPEWQRQLRLEAVPAYQKLVMETETNAETETEREEAVNLEGEPISDPVLLLPDVANVWSYTELTAHWVKTGLNFSNEVVSETGFAQRVRRLHNVEPRQGRLSLSLKRLSLKRLSKRLSSRFNPEEEEDVEELQVQAAPEPEEDFQR